MVVKLTRNMALDYLRTESDEKRASRSFISCLERIVEKSNRGVYLSSDANSFQTDFNQLLDFSQKLRTELVPYSEITRIVYTNGADGMDALTPKFKASLEQCIRKEPDDGQPLGHGYIVLIKTMEHMNLASKQLDNLYSKQATVLQKQEQVLEDVEQGNRKNAKSVKRVKKQIKQLNDIRSSIYGDFVAILGIFSALIFTLFGSFKVFSSAILATAKFPIYRLFISLSLLGIVLLALLFFLLRAIATMSDRQITAVTGTKNPFRLYPFFSFGLFVLVVMMVVGLVLMKLC